VLTAYHQINHELWALYRRGGITQEALATERFRQLLRLLGRGPGRARALGELYLAHLSERGDRLPGCRTAIRSLRSRGLRIGVVTNGIDSVQRRRIAASGLGPLLDVLVTSESAGAAKPDPRIFLPALSALELTPRSVVYVGDDPLTDGVAARAAAIPFVWMDRGDPLPKGTRPPRLRLTHLRDLVALLDGRHSGHSGAASRARSIRQARTR
jgi:FMN phosphatase YigB (HAD superfamily)